jgi:hypothetical protein
MINTGRMCWPSTTADNSVAKVIWQSLHTHTSTHSVGSCQSCWNQPYSSSSSSVNPRENFLRIICTYCDVFAVCRRPPPLPPQWRGSVSHCDITGQSTACNSSTSRKNQTVLLKKRHQLLYYHFNSLHIMCLSHNFISWSTLRTPSWLRDENK